VPREHADARRGEAGVARRAPGVKWIVVESRLLDGEQILMVFEKKHLKEARKAHPGKVIYFPPEIEELRRHKDAPGYARFLKSVHLVKKKFGGWIVPSDSPLARRFDPPKGAQARRKGGDNHAHAKQAGRTARRP
jgi:hypothetical protein